MLSVPKNTQVNNDWAVGVFSRWIVKCNSHASAPNEKCPDDLLTSPHPTSFLNYWLAAFILAHI